MSDAAPIVVINLVRRPDRRAAMTRQLRALGLEARFSPAVDARDWAGAPAPAPRWGDPDPLAPAARACALSHRAVWQALLDGAGEYVCVLEDDVTLSPLIAPVLTAVPALMKGRQLLKLDQTPLGKRRLLLSEQEAVEVEGADMTVARLWSKRLGAGGYILSREGAGKLLSRVQGRRAQAVDHLLFNPVISPLYDGPGAHVLLPFPVWHDLDGSDIEADRVGERLGPGWWRRKLRRSWGDARAIPGRMRARWGGARWVPEDKAAPSGNAD